MPDPVNHPPHYGGEASPYEAIKVIEAWELNFLIGNTVKYLCRAGRKDQNPLLDLEKAAWYLAREIGRRRKLSSCATALASAGEPEKSPWPSAEARTQSSEPPEDTAAPSSSLQRKSPTSLESMREALVGQVITVKSRDKRGEHTIVYDARVVEVAHNKYLLGRVFFTIYVDLIR